MRQIISIANQKGGVGKTTTAINLGASLALADKDVLLIDFDPQGNATTGLGIDKSELELSIYDAISLGKIDQKMIVNTEIDKLYLVPSTTDLYGAEVELVGMLDREYRLKSVIDSVEKEFDFIIIDSPPSLGMLTINSLTAAESVIIPVQTEFYALEGLSQLLRTINMVKVSFNPELSLEGLLFTMKDSRTLLSQQVIDEVKRFYGEKIFESVIPRSVKLSEAPSFGKPIVLYDMKSKGADAYTSLAYELIGRSKDRIKAAGNFKG